MRPRSVIWIVLVVLASVLVGVLISVSSCASSETDWVLTRDPDGDVLHFEVGIGKSCKFLDRIDVDETGLSVKIAAYVDKHGSNCDDILKVEQHEVRLAEPLGMRELLGCDPPSRNLVRGPGLMDCRSVKNWGSEWRLQEPPDGRTLRVAAFVGSSCSAIDHVVVEETRDEVELVVYVRRVTWPSSEADGQAAEECTAGERKIGRTTVELEEPLGDRLLLGCDHPVDLENPGRRAVDPCTEVIWPHATGWTD